MSEALLILIIDDDREVRDSLQFLLEASKFKVRTYSSARSFFAEQTPQAACMIVDVRMPEMDGLELQEEANNRDIDIPIIIITGHGDISIAVRAMKAGAVDFIEKPFSDDVILASIRRALDISCRERNEKAESLAAQQLLALLTPREHHVLDQLVAGRSNKSAALELGISPRTIEIHRAHIMEKMNARSLSDLVRVALTAARLSGDAA